MAEKVRADASEATASDVLAPADEGREYREGVYEPLDEHSLRDAPRTGDFPDPGSGPPFHLREEVPKVPRLRHIVGPSVIALGMGLGSGEFLLWPNLFAVSGLSVMWLFVIGVLAQFVVIGEIERWTVATGESIFTGMGRMANGAFWPWFFLFATLAGFFWPGWGAQSASFLISSINAVLGREAIASTNWQPLALVMMVVIWAALALSRVVYNALERFEILLVVAFFPMLFLTCLFVASLSDVRDLVVGSVAVGSVPTSFISGPQFQTLVTAVAYAGSGGTLLLGQSLWLRDKGFGMARYQGRIGGIRGTNEPITPSGFVFNAGDPLGRRRFQRWMRVGSSDLLWTFAVPIYLSVAFTALIVAGTIGSGNADLAGNLNGTVNAQGQILADRVGTWLQIVFLLGGALVLFSTQVGIVDTVTRLSGDILFDRFARRGRPFNVRRTFLILLTGFVAAGCAIILYSYQLQGRVAAGQEVDSLQPDFLVTIAGPFTITSMFAFACAIAMLNTRYLPPPLRMPRWKLVGMWFAIVLWGWFTAESLTRATFSVLGVTGEVATTIAFHPVRAAFYVGAVAALAYVVARTAGPGFASPDQPEKPALSTTAG